mmetsp:Transcript_11750/g.39080  ORF Transcript_11750/g.39080 Transcript_11750/m.39080 type:complete len:203 (+) Transcript_11750:1438-2046(+)
MVSTAGSNLEMRKLFCPIAPRRPFGNTYRMSPISETSSAAPVSAATAVIARSASLTLHPAALATSPTVTENPKLSIASSTSSRSCFGKSSVSTRPLGDATFSMTSPRLESAARGTVRLRACRAASAPPGAKRGKPKLPSTRMETERRCILRVVAGFTTWPPGRVVAQAPREAETHLTRATGAAVNPRKGIVAIAGCSTAKRG